MDIKESSIPRGEAGYILPFVCLLSFLVSQGWLSSGSRKFASFIPFFCMNRHSWDSGRERCLPSAQDGPTCGILPIEDLTSVTTLVSSLCWLYL